MGRLPLLILFLSLSFFIKAQDTIIKRNGEKIISKVTEVNRDNIRYKKFGNPDGPVYTLEKEQISTVVYLNGSKDSFDDYIAPPAEKTQDLSIQTSGRYYYYKGLRIAESDMHAVIKGLKDPKLNAMVRGIENKKFIQNISAFISVPLFISGIYVYQANQPRRRRGYYAQTSSAAQLQGQKTGLALMIGALACDVVSISFMLDRRAHNRLLVQTYNKKISPADKQ